MTPFHNFRWDKTRNSFLFRWNQVYHPILHTLIRICKQDILNIAFEEVKILENQTLYRPEFITQRIQLLPIKNPTSQTLQTISACSCLQTKCDKCTLMFELKEENPHRFKPCVVFSQSLICRQLDWTGILVLPNVPILELNPGQKIALQAEVQLHTPRKHARYALCCKATYVLVSTMKEDRPYQLSEINASDELHDYDVVLESIGTISPEKIFCKSFQLLKDKMESFAQVVWKESQKGLSVS